MTGTEVITQARLYLADTTDQSISDDAWIAYINEAQRRFACDTHIMQYMTTRTIETNSTSLAHIINNSKQSLLSILKITAAGVNIPKTSLMDSQDDSASTPERYAVVGKYIYWMTTLTSFSVSMKFYFSFIPAAITALTDTLEMYDQWKPAIVKYVIYQAHLANRDAGLANGAYTEYQEQVKLAQTIAATRLA